MTEIKVFNRWETTGVVVSDFGMQSYINLNPRFVPKTGGRNAAQKFHKSKTFLIERFMNKIMVSGHKAKKHKISSGHNGGKAQMITKIMIKVLEMLEAKTKKNPIQVLVTALENACPREEIIAIEYGGARYPKAVECSPQRRIDLAMRFMTQGAAQKAFNSKKSIEETLSDEIYNAFILSPNSAAISKKNELERQADSSR
ncbi:30S ribosomal protein S7 [Candidatus Woesearchaeota archaeon]|nr:30S ribosomal protein S7 [Candidatus Woesearchaeota archaeon]